MSCRCCAPAVSPRSSSACANSRHGRTSPHRQPFRGGDGPEARGYAPPMTKRTGARTGGRILVDQLKIQGCDRIFTVPGESFLAVLDALHDTPEIDTVVFRQEAGAGYLGLPEGR